MNPGLLSLAAALAQHSGPVPKVDSKADPGELVHNSGILRLHDRVAEAVRARERYEGSPTRKNRRRVAIAERRESSAPRVR